MADLPATLTGLQQAIATGQVAAVDALAIQRRRLLARDQGLFSIVSVPAAEPEVEPQPGPVGRLRLAGIGLAHKDVFDTRGFRPGLGHDRGAVDPGRRDARAIARLARQGAAHLARLTMAEYACGATAANRRQPVCRNPLDRDAVVGGSSSGSAVAVAGGLAYGSLGTDTGGSVRIPAATCGLVGLKTTHGLISRQGVFPLAPSLDSVGILARTPADAAELLAVLAERPLGQDADGLRQQRVRVFIPPALEATVADAMADFARRLEGESAVAGSAGHCAAVDVITALPALRRLAEQAEALMAAESAEVHRADLLAGNASSLVEAVALAGLAIAPAWAAALRSGRAGRLRAFVAEAFDDAGLLVVPALATPVPDWPAVTPTDPAYDAQRHLGLFRYMGFVNYLGLPAVVLPIAADARGLPISVQVLARPFDDARLLAWASHVDRSLYGGQGFPALRH